MEAFETDEGTLQLLGALERSAARRLADFLETCDALRANNPSASIVFQPVDFAGRDDVVEMKLERRIGADRKILSTVKLANGALWRRGQLRIPGLELPEAVRQSVKGRMIEEIVDAPPFTGFEVTGAVQDGSGADGHLRLRCTAERTGPIQVDAESAPEHDMAALEALAAAHADVPVDPVTAQVLRSVDRREALTALLRAAEAKAGTVVDLSVAYHEILSADAPARFARAGEVVRHANAFYARQGPPPRIGLKRVKAGFQIMASLCVPDAESYTGEMVAVRIEDGRVHRAEPQGDPADDATPIHALGFDVPGLQFGKAGTWFTDGSVERRLLPLAPLGDAMGLA